MKRLPSLPLAAGAVAVFVLAGAGLQAIVPAAAVSFLLFIPPVLIAAFYGGPSAALVATVLGALAAEYFLAPRAYRTDWLARGLYPLALYLSSGLGVALLARRLSDARADVQRSEKDFATLFRLMPIGIGVANDRECRNISVNPAFAEMLRIHRTANASLSAPLSERPPFVVEKDGETVPTENLPLQLAARLGTEVKHVELDVVHADGTRLTLYEYAAPLFDDDGQVRGAVGAFLDITERKQSEERLKWLVRENEALYHQAQEANRLKDEFLATLSHELRTPLNALLGWIHLLKSGQLTPEKRDRAMAAIERSAFTQARLTADLLDISGVVTGKLRLSFEPTKVGPILDAVMESLGPTAEAKGVTCRWQTTIDEPFVLDGSRIQQILTNLVANAIKFTPNGGEVHIAASRAGDELMFEVRDTGVGIPPGFLPHVFERFRQADGGSTRPVGGLGLGLSIVKELAERHGGHVHAESAGLNQGATFTVRLPARKTRPISSPSIPVARGPAR